MLLLENTTNMPSAVAATAWGHLLTCPTMNDKVFDAVRAFRASYINKGPEVVPKSRESPAAGHSDSLVELPEGSPPGRSDCHPRSRLGTGRGR